MIKMTSFVAAMLTACTAYAVPQGAFWVEIPVVDHPDDTTDLSGYRCFHLYVELEPGDTIEAADFGITGPNDGLQTTQTVFQHPFGNDLAPSDLIVDFALDIFYDSYVSLGDLDGAASQVVTPIGPIGWDPSGFVGVWTKSVGSPDAQPNFGNAFRLAQVTVTSVGEFQEGTAFIEFLGGEVFLAGDGPNGEFGQQAVSTGVVSIPNFQPLSSGTLPGQFDMLTPACGAEGLPPHQTELTWEPLPNAIEYQVVVTSDFRLLDPVFTADSISGTSFTIPAGVLEPCTTYYWYARATDGVSFSKMATNWQLCSFTTMALGDLNADGVVDTADLSLLIGAFVNGGPGSDLNGDGVVDTADLGLLIANFGQICG